MNKFTALWIALAVSASLTGCRLWTLDRWPPYDEDDPTTATIPVTVDWSASGIDVDPDDPTGGEAVHRVSLRFYPRDGSAVFVQYLEGDIFRKDIRLAVGVYDIVAMNEAVDDPNHWDGLVSFTDTGSFSGFAAELDPMTEADRDVNFPDYTPAAGEQVVVVPPALASWSREGFAVTDAMALSTRAVAEPLVVEMRALTHEVTLGVRVVNLVSAKPINVAVKGFTSKVYMASGETVQSPATHLVRLNQRTLDAGDRDGRASRTFLSFGRVPREEPTGTYMVEMGITLTSGEKFEPDRPLVFDVTDQVTAGTDLDVDIDITRASGEIELPVVEGGIAIDDWDDETIQLN